MCTITAAGVCRSYQISVIRFRSVDGSLGFHEGRQAREGRPATGLDALVMREGGQKIQQLSHDKEAALNSGKLTLHAAKFSSIYSLLIYSMGIKS